MADHSSFFSHDGIKLFEGEVVMGFGVIHDISVVHHLSQLFIVQGFT